MRSKEPEFRIPGRTFNATPRELFLNPLGFNGGSIGSTVCYMDGTDPCAAPLQVLTTPELIQQGPSSLTGASNIVLAVQNAFTANPGAYDADHPLTIFGYSQSATAASIAMERLDALGIPHDSLHFVFIGDPSMPATVAWSNIEAAMVATLGPDLTNWLLKTFGMTEVLGNVTPNDLYAATIYSLPGDPVPNFSEVYEEKGLFGALLDILWPHVWYLGLNPDQIADATTVNGDLTYIDIHDSDINGLSAWLDAVFSGGAANSGLFDSLWGSLQLLFGDFF